MGLFAVPYRHRTADLGRDLWRLPSQSPLLRGKVYICSREDGASRDSLTSTEQIKTGSGKSPFERTWENTGGQITCTFHTSSWQFPYRHCWKYHTRLYGSSLESMHTFFCFHVI